MTPDHVIAVAKQYRAAFIKKGIAAEKHPTGEFPHDSISALEHCHRMLDNIITFASEGRTGKAYRWLGFVQGVCWSSGMYTIDDMRDHNRG